MKTRPGEVSHRYDIVIPYCVYMKGRDFILHFHEGTVHVGRRDSNAILDWKSKTTQALPIPDSGESDFMPEQTVVPLLHDSGMRFCTGMRISLRYSNQGVPTLV